MWLVLSFFLLWSQSPSTASEAHSLVVQAVDPNWLPLPGAEITVRPLSQQAQSKVVRTDDEGYARFSLDGGTEYSIEAKMQGFKKTHLKHIRLIKPNPTVPNAYVQLKMQPSGPPMVVN